MIDIGHGGKDGGVEIEGVFEKDLTFEIAQKILNLNTNSEIKIVLTRDSDTFISLEDRVEYINSLNPDLVISLHINSDSNTRKNGFDLYVSPQKSINNESELLAKKIETSFSNEFSSNGIEQSKMYILKNINVSSTPIALGYLSNPGDRRVLTSKEGQHSIAQAINNALK